MLLSLHFFSQVCESKDFIPAVLSRIYSKFGKHAFSIFNGNLEQYEFSWSSFLGRKHVRKLKLLEPVLQWMGMNQFHDITPSFNLMIVKDSGPWNCGSRAFETWWKGKGTSIFLFVFCQEHQSRKEWEEVILLPPSIC